MEEDDDGELKTDQLQFTQEEPLSDVALVVEGQRLYTSKSLLGFASPVFKCMFTSTFKERDQSEVPLPDKNAKTIDEMLRFLHPAMDENLKHGQDSAFRLLPVADEYQLFKLKNKCEQVLIDSIQSVYPADGNFVIKCIQASTRYGLQMLLKSVVKKCSNSKNLVTHIRKNQDLTTEIKLKIVEARLDVVDYR